MDLLPIKLVTVQPCPLLTTLFALRRALAGSTSYMSMDSLAVPAPLLVKCRQSLSGSFKLAATPWCFTNIQCPRLRTSLLYSLAAVKENFKYHNNDNKCKNDFRNGRAFLSPFQNSVKEKKYIIYNCLSNNSVVKLVKEKKGPFFKKNWLALDTGQS